MKKLVFIGSVAVLLTAFAGVTVAASAQSTMCQKYPYAACKKHPKPKPKPKPKSKPPAVLVARLSLGAPTFDLTDGFGSLWARVGSDTANGGDTIERIDPATNAITAKITVATGFGLAIGDGSVWAPSLAANTLTRIDPTTNGISATIHLPDVGADAVATTPGNVWVGTQGAPSAAGVLADVSTATNTVTGTTLLPDGAVYLAANGNAIWVVAGMQLVRVDASTRQATTLSTISNQLPCGDVTADDTSVWLAGGNCGFPHFSIEKLDPFSGGVLAQPQIATTLDVALGLGSAWATTAAGTLIRLNEATGKVSGSMKIDLGNTTVVHAGLGALWIVDTSSGALERFKAN